MPLHVIDAALNQRIGSAIGELVPAIRCPDSKRGKLVLDLIDALQQLFGRKTATVETLGSDSDGVDDLFVTRDSLL